jgi:4-amino-4-deoxy-L-arabinose transferase-like glycosyltransferase
MFLDKYSKYFRTVLLLLILLVGILVRVWNLGINPPGLNQDEAAAGYDAWALLNYGIDRNGMANPMYLVSWGVGQSVLYSVLSMPFLFLFGLTPFAIRLPNAILSCITLLLFYVVVKKTIHPRAGLIGLFLLAVNPWHVMGARWGFEANLFPLVFMVGFTLLVYAKNRPVFMYGAYSCFALALYSYSPAFFFIPLFVVWSTAWIWRFRFAKKKIIVTSFVIFFAMSLPYLMFLAVNILGLETTRLGFLTIPRLVNGARFSELFLPLQAGALRQILKNAYHVFQFFFIQGTDGLAWNSIAPFGYGYMFSAPLLMYGLFLVMKNATKLGWWLVWITVSFALCFLTVFNMNRAGIVFLPVVFATTLACFSLLKRVPLFFVAVLVFYLYSFFSFSRFYFREYPEFIGPSFAYSFGEAIEKASSLSKNGPVTVTDKANMAYIYVLFYDKVPPDQFLKTVKYADPQAQFRGAVSFGRYKMGIQKDKLKPDMVYVFRNSEEEYFDKGYKLHRFKNYSVAQPL